MNTSKASIKFSEIPVSSHFGNYGSLGGTLISNRHRGPPAQTDPLANVVGQTSPQGFDPNLNQATQRKLPQPKLLLNPRMGEFVVGPKGIPEAISKKLGETFKKVTEGDDFQKVLVNFNIPYEYLEGGKLEKDIPAEYKFYETFLKKFGVKKEN